MTKTNQIIIEHQNMINGILNDSNSLLVIDEIIELFIHTFNSGNKVLLCGNGGSATDAEHIAAELSGRFKLERPPLNAEALHVNGAALTAVANDFGYEFSFSRLLEAKGAANDILVLLSTSGESPNVLNALTKAKALGMKTIAITGNSENSLSRLTDLVVNIPSDNTARIQEATILVGHIICEKVEQKLFE